MFPQQKAHCWNFNPRPREEGDTFSAIIAVRYSDFNPRPREEGDGYVFDKDGNVYDFNPRPREEGDLKNNLFKK